MDPTTHASWIRYVQISLNSILSCFPVTVSRSSQLTVRCRPPPGRSKDAEFYAGFPAGPKQMPVPYRSHSRPKWIPTDPQKRPKSPWSWCALQRSRTILSRRTAKVLSHGSFVASSLYTRHGLELEPSTKHPYIHFLLSFFKASAVSLAWRTHGIWM